MAKSSPFFRRSGMGLRLSLVLDEDVAGIDLFLGRHAAFSCLVIELLGMASGVAAFLASAVQELIEQHLVAEIGEARGLKSVDLRPIFVSAAALAPSFRSTR